MPAVESTPGTPIGACPLMWDRALPPTGWADVSQDSYLPISISPLFHRNTSWHFSCAHCQALHVSFLIIPLTRCGYQVHVLRCRKTFYNDILGLLLWVPPFSILPALWNINTAAGISAATFNMKRLYCYKQGGLRNKGKIPVLLEPRSNYEPWNTYLCLPL